MKETRRPLSSWLRRVRRRVSAAPRRVRWAAAGLAAASLIGCVWLLLSLGSTSFVPISQETWSETLLLEAQGLLDSAGIRSQVLQGRLTVPENRLSDARAVLRGEGLLNGEGEDDFSRVVEQEDLWSTQAQTSRRWLAAKMATFRREIRRMPGVRNAAVVLEPGSRASLGGSASPPTASVMIDLKPGARLLPRTVEAIADLVCGGVAGMSRRDVRIVDSTGRSYAAPDVGYAGGPLEEVRATEAYYEQKARAVLGTPDDAILDIRVDPNALRCIGAWVSLPISQMTLLAHQAAGEANRPICLRAESRVRELLAGTLRLPAASAVEVHWHESQPIGSIDAGPAGDPQTQRSSAGWLLSAGMASLAAGALAWWAVRWLRRSRVARSGSAALACFRGDPAVEGEAASTWEVLELVSAEDLLRFLEDEDPETIAIVLSRLSGQKAAAVLSGLSPERQIEVAKRIVELQRLDPQTIHDVEQTLESELREFACERSTWASGEAKLAELLQHAGLATERNVLQGLAARQPALAESLRGRMFAFDDIASLPPWRLRPVLDAVSEAELAVALRTATRETVRKVFSCLPGPVGRRLRAEMEQTGAVRLSDVEAAQERIIDGLRRAEAGLYASHATETNDLVV